MRHGLVQWKAHMTESVKPLNHLTLSEAQKTGRLQDFILQQQTAGLEAISSKEFDETVAGLVKAPQSPNQTSGSRVPGGSTGK